MPTYEAANPPTPNEIGEKLSHMDLGVEPYKDRYVQTKDTCLAVTYTVGEMFGLNIKRNGIWDAMREITNYRMGWSKEDPRKLPNPQGVCVVHRSRPEILGDHFYLRVGGTDYNFGAGDNEGFTDIDMIPLSAL